MDYNHKEIEAKWQQYWKDNATYKTKIDHSRPKFYVLDMFPYPSGAGLHVGHPLGYIASDIFSRYKRQKGSYAKAMEKYGLQRGVRGSEARHTTTAQYYRDLKRQTGELEANMRQLQTEQQQAEQQLNEVRQEVKSEKLEAAKTEAKAAVVAKVGSLFGSNKLKEEREELQQRISTLKNQCNR